MRYWLLTAILLAGHAAGQESPGFRGKPLSARAEGKVGFAAVPASRSAVTFSNYVALDRHLTNQMLLNGSGVAAGDVDGDGWCDLYFCGLDGPNILYRNLGDWQFQDITATAGVACPGIDATGAVLADLDGDFDLDLLVNSMGQGTHLFINNGKARFTKSPTVLNAALAGMTTAIADVDGDGWLDVYIANYRSSALVDMPNTEFRFRVVDGKRVVATVNGRPVSDPEFSNRYVVTAAGGISELGERDMFYRNVGGTNFVPFAESTFLDEDGKPLRAPVYDWGLSAMFYDINQDMLPDLFVCNDFDTPDRFWINKGNGRFQAIPRLALRKSSFFSMGADFADFNRDGFPDFFVLDMLGRSRHARLTQMPARSPGEFEDRPQYLMNTLYLNRGNGTFAEIAQLSGVDATDWSWSPIFLDVDLDGWEDLLVTNGNERDARNMDIAAVLRKNRTERSLSNLEILRNRKIVPRLPNRNVAYHNQRDLTFKDVSQEWSFDFLGVSHGMALADLDNDGDMDVAVNNLHALAGLYRNLAGAPRLGVRLKGKAPNTRGIGARIKVTGGPVPQQQEIISGGRYLSCDEALRVFAAGPEMAIEVIWRSGKRSRVASAKPNHIYELDEAEASPVGDVQPNTAPMFTDVSHLLKHTHHQTNFNDFDLQPLLPRKLSQSGPAVSWVDVDGDDWDDLVIGQALFRNEGNGKFSELFKQPPGGTNLTADIDADGDLDFFVAGRSIPGKYPQAADSFLVRNVDGRPQPETLAGIGLVNGAVFSDLDDDGDLDLALACEWGPVRVLRNERGRFSDATEALGLAQYKGWWNGVSVGDFDEDGRMDLIASNWGRNLPNRGPIQAFYGEGLPDLVETYYDAGLQKRMPVRGLDIMAKVFPFIRERFATHESYAAASVKEVFGQRLDNAKVVEANWFDSTLFLNRSNRFEARPLPIEAQFAPAFGICVADFDGDGHKDIFVNQNFFAVRPEIPRYDAGSGQLLLGNGRGDFSAISPRVSGIEIFGEGRGCAAADFDGDGRVDLAIGQNGAQTKLFRNVTAKRE